MKILVLDDDLMRHKSFGRVYEGHEIVHVYSPHEAVNRMRETHFDLIHLDHDLGWFESIVTEKGTQKFEVTGYHVVCWMIENSARLQPTRVIVHSHSVNGKIMRADLQRAGFDVTWKLFTPDREDQGWFYITTLLHEPGAKCEQCSEGFPAPCEGCGQGFVHCQFWDSEHTTGRYMDRKCDHCYRHTTEEIFDLV